MKNQQSYAQTILLLTLTLLLSHLTAHAQSATATLSGTVTDERGAVVVGAKVSATNDATNLVRKTVTNADGLFTLPLLSPGVYSLNVERDGFAPVGKREVIWRAAVGADSTARRQHIWNCERSE